MQDARLDQAQIYTEFGGLNAMKAQAKRDKAGALEGVARQFESMFISQMLSAMRSANQVFSEGNFLNSQRTEFVQQMFDSQISQTLSAGKGIGLAERLKQQMQRQIPDMDRPEHATISRGIGDYPRNLPSLSQKLPENVARVEAMKPQAPAHPKPSSETLPARFESPQQFVQKLWPVASEVAADAGLDPRVLVAQAALETGWGRHMIEGDQAQPSFNLFGIKADSRWGGDAVDITTTEYREGLPVKQKAAFRAYEDYRASFRDYVDFLESNPRYKQVLEHAADPEAYVRELQEAGYATDPAYGEKIQNIMNGEWVQSALEPANDWLPGQSGQERE
ncbi:flagellar assembly peptidoglycan hydrolase FlgJ [Marinobacteraceae bacterium S3BR75-40.1]